MALTIAELPFIERPVLELLNLEGERSLPAHDYAGYGWARVDRVWLDDPEAGRFVDDALVLALHSPDDCEPLTDDVELEFDLPDDSSVIVLASAFLGVWLPRLPQAASIVLALCNPHSASLPRVRTQTAPLHYALGDVTSWLDRDRGDRIELVADAWVTLHA